MTYRIGEVARMLEVSTASLRSWERHMFIPRPHRSPTDRRLYCNEDIQAIRDYLTERKMRT
jgi:DNA-binding transcriptional MerR regulator